MPLQDPPDPKNPTSRTVPARSNMSSKIVNSPLAEIARCLAAPDQRWKAIQLLRVLRLTAPNALISRSTLAHLPPDYGDFFLDPRTSRVAKALGVAETAASAAHLDIDWFGPPAFNWWSGLDGSAWMYEVIGGLTNHLENSLGIERSRPDPDSWKCPPNNESCSLDELGTIAWPAGATANYEVCIEWTAVKGGSDFRVREDDQKLKITTPRPGASFTFVSA